jgi:hypothetical protein
MPHKVENAFTAVSRVTVLVASIRIRNIARFKHRVLPLWVRRFPALFKFRFKRNAPIRRAQLNWKILHAAKKREESMTPTSPIILCDISAGLREIELLRHKYSKRHILD